MPRDSGGEYYTIGGIKVYRRAYRGNTLAPASTLDTQTSTEEQQRNIPAESQVIPLAYGKCQIGARWFAMTYDATSNTWTLGGLFCLGEIGGYERLLVNGVDALGSPEIDGLTINYYTGTTTQTADPILATYFPGYTDTLVHTQQGESIGIAYVALNYSDDLYSTFPEVIAEIDAKKVYSPSTGTVIFSENPALHLNDFETSALYGRGRIGTDSNLTALMDACNATADTSPQEPLRVSGAVFDTPQSMSDIESVLATYASTWVLDRGEHVFYTPDRPSSPVMSVDESDIVEGTFSITRGGLGSVPTVVGVSYTDTTADKWRSVVSDLAKAPGVDAGTVDWRESRINLEGVKRHSQAYREAVERLNKGILQDVSISFTMFDKGLELEAGDVINVSHPVLGSPNVIQARLTSDPVEPEPGRLNITCQEYDENAYSSDVAEFTPGDDGNSGNGGKPSPPEGVAVESVPYKTIDGFWSARLNVSWGRPSDGSVVTHYYVRVEKSDESPVVPVWDATVASIYNDVSTGPLEENASYTVYVYAVNSVINSLPVVSAATLIPNATPPGDVSGLSVVVTGSTLTAHWDASSDAVKYRVRYWPTSGGSWGTGTELDEVYGLSTATNSIDQGSPATTSFTLGVRAVDSVGNVTSAETQAFVWTGSTDGISIFYQGQSTDGIPTSNAPDDLWYDTDSDNRPYRAIIAGADEIKAGEWEPENDDLQNKVDLAYVEVVTSTQTADFAASVQHRYPVSTAGGAVEMQLPANPQPGSRVLFFDVPGLFDVDRLIIRQDSGSPPELIMGLDEDLEVDVRYFAGTLQFIDTSTGWVLA